MGCVQSVLLCVLTQQCFAPVLGPAALLVLLGPAAAAPGVKLSSINPALTYSWACSAASLQVTEQRCC